MNKTTLSLVAWKFRVAHLELNGMSHEEHDYLVDSQPRCKQLMFSFFFSLSASLYHLIRRLKLRINQRYPVNTRFFPNYRPRGMTYFVTTHVIGRLLAAILPEAVFVLRKQRAYLSDSVRVKGQIQNKITFYGKDKKLISALVHREVGCLLKEIV